MRVRSWKTKPKLPRGWSYPWKTSEVEELFPTIGKTYWNSGGRLTRNQEQRLVFSLTWSPRTALPQPVLHISPVPSDQRAAIRAWIESTAATEAQEWVRAAEHAFPTWRDARHRQAWIWAATPDPVAE